MAEPIITGIHHVTAIAGLAQRNLRFYTRTLGLRLVKKTVNFDDPFTYHLYYGDAIGSPGTLATHFPHARATRGRHGTAEISETTMRVPEGALGAWIDWLGGRGVALRRERVLGRDRVLFEDPDSMRLALIESSRPDEQSSRTDRNRDGAPAADGVDRVVIRSPEADATIDFLTSTLGFSAGESDDGRVELRLGSGESSACLEVIDDRSERRAKMSAGVVHHVAWRVPDNAGQARVADRLRTAGLDVTPVMDRQYFRSIYFRIPGGVIFEVATDGPGFEIDETRESLGAALKLPPQHEPRREAIEARLEPLAAS